MTKFVEIKSSFQGNENCLMRKTTKENLVKQLIRIPYKIAFIESARIVNRILLLLRMIGMSVSSIPNYKQFEASICINMILIFLQITSCIVQPFKMCQSAKSSRYQMFRNFVLKQNFICFEKRIWLTTEVYHLFHSS